MSVATPLDQLGPDLEALVADLGVPLRRVSTLTTLPATAVPHAAFRIELADGRVLKGRRVASAPQAARVEQILAVMDRRHFPAILARSGVALLEEWLPGDPVAESAGLGFVRRCGAVLGRVHDVAPPTGLEAPLDTPAAVRRAAVHGQVARLAAMGGLSDGEAHRVGELVEEAGPARPAIGLIHRDFCSENLLRDRAGQPRVVDNETMQVGPLDLDLARTWYRWPMTDAQATAFLRGYARHRSPAAFLRHFPFWALAVLVDTALFRLRAGTGRAEVPLRRLRAFLREPAAPHAWIAR